MAVRHKRQSELMPAAAVAGHHVGLRHIVSPRQVYEELLAVLAKEPTTTPDIDSQKRAVAAYRNDGFDVPDLDSGFTPSMHRAADMLDTRMLFSTLVDADFIATEGHFDGDADQPYRPRRPGLDLDATRMLERLLGYLDSLRSKDGSTDGLHRWRQRLMEDCTTAGRHGPTGTFTLTAPTGAGKTLAMLRFAVEHALRHDLRRIVLVMPFLNIIEQTAAIYRDLFPDGSFGEGYVLESHSLAGRDDPENDAVDAGERRRRLIAQNWDAPVVLTTNVGLLESLHADRPSRCRRLHRLAGSVILFDEVQTLPPRLATLTLATLSRLADADGPYRTSVVFATATQPAFESLSDRLAELSSGDPPTPPPRWRPAEIVRNPAAMFAGCGGRIRLDWQEQTPRTMDELAAELATIPRVACIVNLKRHATDLAERLDETVDDDAPVFHLSTAMCATHRRKTLDRVRERLDAGRPVRLVATQCIEAGVDIDFPRLYRAFAPLDSIAQAAGRCNRHGKNPTGEVVVFDIDGEPGRNNYPPGYGEGITATRMFVNGLRQDDPSALDDVLSDPEQLRSYFRLLYSTSGRDRGGAGSERELHDHVRATDFGEVARRYRLIDDDVVHVLVPHEAKRFDELLEIASPDQRLSPRAVRRWQAIAGPHSVNVYRRALADVESQLLPISFGSQDDRRRSDEIDWWYLRDPDAYTDQFGLRFPEESWVV